MRSLCTAHTTTSNRCANPCTVPNQDLWPKSSSHETNHVLPAAVPGALIPATHTERDIGRSQGISPLALPGGSSDISSTCIYASGISLSQEIPVLRRRAPASPGAFSPLGLFAGWRPVRARAPWKLTRERSLGGKRELHAKEDQDSRSNSPKSRLGRSLRERISSLERRSGCCSVWSVCLSVCLSVR